MLNELINRINIYTPMIGRNRIGKEKIIQSTISLWVCHPVDDCRSGSVTPTTKTASPG